MNDYSDLIFLMGAMIIFSLLSMQTSRMFQMNNRIQINGEIEYHAVSIAQDQIDQIRWIKDKSSFNTFISTYPKQVPIAVGSDTLYYNVDTDVKNITIPGSNVENRKITISVKNKFLMNKTAGDRSVKLQFVKSFDS